jgi:cytochrome c-type biogenesis protein CcmH/NrfG
VEISKRGREVKKHYFILFVLILCLGCGSNNQSPQQGAKPPEGSVDVSNALMEQGKKFLNSGDIRKAIAVFDQAIMQNPSNLQAYTILSELYMRMKDFNRAVDTLRAAERVAPENGEIKYLLALNLGFAGHASDAITTAQQSAEIFQRERDDENFKKAIGLVQGLMKAQEDANQPTQVKVE